MKLLVLLTTVAHVSEGYVIGWAENISEFVSLITDVSKWFHYIYNETYFPTTEAIGGFVKGVPDEVEE